MVGGDNDGLGEEINRSNMSSDGSEYATNRSGEKRKRKGGRRGKKAKKVKMYQAPAWPTDGSPSDLTQSRWRPHWHPPLQWFHQNHNILAVIIAPNTNYIYTI